MRLAASAKASVRPRFYSEIIDADHSPRHSLNLVPRQVFCRCQPESVGEGKWRREREKEGNRGRFGRCFRRA